MIKSLYIDNFKALNDFHMDLDSFTVIVGNNMSGKSTVLQALDFMANTVKTDFGIILERRGWKVADVKSQMQKSSKITIKCDLDLKVDGERMIIQWELEILAYTSKNIMELSRELIQVKREDRNEIILKYTQSDGGYMLDGSGEKLKLTKELRLNSSILKLYNLNRYPIVQSVKNFFEHCDSFELLSPEKMRLSSRGDVDTIGNAGEKLPSFVKAMDSKQKKQFEIKIKNVLGDKIVRVDARTKGKPGWTQLIAEEKYKNRILTIESKNMSDGMLRLLAFLAICEMDKSSMMMLDEIENGINMDYAEKIIAVLEENCIEKSNQLIVTTHSPVFLDYVPKEKIRYIYRDPDSGNCRCGLLTENPDLNNKMQYMYPGELFMNLSNHDIITMLMEKRDL